MFMTSDRREGDRSTRRRAKSHVLASVSLLILSTPAIAFAQDAAPALPTTPSDVAQPDPAPAADAGEVVVTGSRISRAGFAAPTPITVISKEDVNLQAPNNIGDVLTRLPSFRATSTPNTAGVTSNGGGRYQLDLRGLGASRTLVLLDGHRFTSGQVDLNQIPTLLIDHADVVTGGASAAWGSDAVAGVVNLALTKKLQGIEGTIQYGQSELGDDQEGRISLAAGSSFAGGRGSFVIGGDAV